jgi:hypothetical protein
MDPGELPAMFAQLEVRAGDSASPAVLAMSHQFERDVKRTLSLRTRPVGAFRDPGERGQPPAMRTGALRNSVITAGGGGAVIAEASVGPTIFYAGVQEFGGSMHARPGGYMRFRSGGEWFLKHVRVGPNPYMRPTLAADIGSGTLGRAAADGFDIAMWGR